MRAVTTTWAKSAVGSMVSIVPSATSLFMILVLPASSPSAEVKVIVMVGPRSERLCQASHPAASAATMGRSQMTEKRRWRCCATFGGWSCSLAMAGLRHVPHQTRVEAFRRDHGCDDDRPKRKDAGSGFDRCDLSQCHERGEKRG